MPITHNSLYTRLDSFIAWSLGHNISRTQYLIAYHRKIKRLRHERSELRTMCEKLKRQNKELRNEIRHRLGQESIDREKETLVCRIECLEKRRKELESEVAGTHEEIESLGSQLEESIALNRKYEADLLYLHNAISRMG